MNDAASPDLATLPARVDRATGAKLVTQYFFRVSPRTLEAWPLPVRQINGRAHYDTAALLAFARAKMEAAPPPHMGGRRPKQPQHVAA